MEDLLCPRANIWGTSNLGQAILGTSRTTTLGPPESKFETLAQLVAHHSKLSDGLCMVLRHPIPNPRKPPLHSWELDRSDIEMGQRLGVGLFGTVYKALLKGKTTVAVKRFKVRYEHMLTI